MNRLIRDDYSSWYSSTNRPPVAMAGTALTYARSAVPTAVEAKTARQDVLVALTFGLELIRCGAMLVAPDGCLRLANRAAGVILETRDGLSLTTSKLAAERACDTKSLQDLLRRATEYPDQGEPKGSPMILPRRIAGSFLILRVIPAPALKCWPNVDGRAALVTLYDENKNMAVDEAVFCKLYGLTRGEAALAAILLQGKSLEHAATDLFISPHTARTHLKRIFVKTDTHRQSELVVRLFSATL